MIENVLLIYFIFRFFELTAGINLKIFAPKDAKNDAIFLKSEKPLKTQIAFRFF